jgi:hypothetical protein
VCCSVADFCNEEGIPIESRSELLVEKCGRASGCDRLSRCHVRNNEAMTGFRGCCASITYMTEETLLTDEEDSCVQLVRISI